MRNVADVYLGIDQFENDFIMIMPAVVIDNPRIENFTLQGDVFLRQPIVLVLFFLKFIPTRFHLIFYVLKLFILLNKSDRHLNAVAFIMGEFAFEFFHR